MARHFAVRVSRVRSRVWRFLCDVCSKRRRPLSPTFAEMPVPEIEARQCPASQDMAHLLDKLSRKREFTRKTALLVQGE